MGAYPIKEGKGERNFSPLLFGECARVGGGEVILRICSFVLFYIVCHRDMEGRIVVAIDFRKSVKASREASGVNF